MTILLDAVALAILALFGLTADTTDCFIDPATGITVCVCEAPERWTP